MGPGRYNPNIDPLHKKIKAAKIKNEISILRSPKRAIENQILDVIFGKENSVVPKNLNVTEELQTDKPHATFKSRTGRTVPFAPSFSPGPGAYDWKIQETGSMQFRSNIP